MSIFLSKPKSSIEVYCLYPIYPSLLRFRSRRTLLNYEAKLTYCAAITKNGLTRLSSPPALDLNKYKSDKKITDEEVLKILEQPLSKSAGSKNKNKKKKKKAVKKSNGEDDDEDDDESSDDDD